MRRRPFAPVAALTLLAVAGAAGPARPAEPLAVDLSHHQVAITTGFSGTDLLLFGTVETAGSTRNTDVVVVVRGPDGPVTLRHKRPVFGFWINTGTARIAAAPSFYQVAATQPLDLIAPQPVRDQLGLELERLPIEIVSDDGDPESYRQALWRLMRQRGVYGNGIGMIGRPGGRLFRADLHLPATVPVGIYRVEVHVFRQGRLIGTRTTPLVVDRMGVGAAIHDFAHRDAPLYGLGAVVLAALSGWLAAMIFRKG